MLRKLLVGDSGFLKAAANGLANGLKSGKLIETVDLAQSLKTGKLRDHFLANQYKIGKLGELGEKTKLRDASHLLKLGILEEFGEKRRLRYVAHLFKLGKHEKLEDIGDLTDLGDLGGNHWDLENLIISCAPVVPHTVLALQLGRSLAFLNGWDIKEYSAYPSIHGFYGDAIYFELDLLSKKNFELDFEYTAIFFKTFVELNYQLTIHWPNLNPKWIKSYQHFYQGFWVRRYARHGRELGMTIREYFECGMFLFFKVSPILNRVLKGLYEEFGLDSEFKVKIFFERIKLEGLPEPTLHTVIIGGRQILVEFKFYEDYYMGKLIRCPEYRRVRNWYVSSSKKEEVNVNEFQPLQPYDPSMKLWTV